MAVEFKATKEDLKNELDQVMANEEAKPEERTQKRQYARNVGTEKRRCYKCNQQEHIAFVWPEDKPEKEAKKEVFENNSIIEEY